MGDSFGSRLKHAWNAFLNRDPTRNYRMDLGGGYSYRPDRPRIRSGGDKTIITAIYNRIAMDVAAINIQHVKLDEAGRYTETLNSTLNECLNTEANIDQSGRQFVQDIVMSMLDEGCVAIVPVDCGHSPTISDSYDILSMRTGKILEWFPRHVRVRVYNDRTGQREDLLLPKTYVAIVENPFYAVMNEPNGTLQRLVRKLSLLDSVDEQSSSGKLDLIIQLPYVIKSEARRQQAENRRRDIEQQLSGSKYGIAYTDGTERITQLNRSLENNLLKQIEFLTSMLYGQLGISKEILEGTASEEQYLNYIDRTVEPIVSAIVDAMRRTFLTKTARTRGHSIKYFRDPFRIVTMKELADLADKLTRNEIATSNEVRQIIGMKPSTDPSADELRNKNIAQPADKASAKAETSVEPDASSKVELNKEKLKEE